MIHWKRYSAELVGTAALLCAVIGSGIMAEQLAGGNMALALLANTLATVFALYVLIETLGPISGAHFNPVVSMVLAFRKDLARHHLMGYVLAQLMGAALGAWIAHAMFELEIFQWSAKVRTGPAQWLAEAVATGGLLFVILRSLSYAWPRLCETKNEFSIKSVIADIRASLLRFLTRFCAWTLGVRRV